MEPVVSSSLSPASTPSLSEQVVLRAEDDHDEVTLPFSNSTDVNTCLAGYDFPPDLVELEVDSDCERRDRDSTDRHRHSELIKLGAAGAGKSGKIGVCVTSRFTTSFTTSFTISF